MKIQVLGGHGGVSKGFLATSFLIDDTLLLDAGAVTESLSVDEQSRIDHILISHSHLDHIKDLAFICDNCFGMKGKPFQVYTHATVKSLLKSHLFNDMIWPDFTSLPSTKNPTMEIHAIDSEKEFHIGDYTIKGVKVKHQNDAMGFIIEKNNVAVLFTADTGPTERIWEIAHTVKNLKAIFTEVSFPNELQKVADVSDHHTPQSINSEIGKMPGHVPIILTHLKPNFRSKIEKELDAIGNKRIQVLQRDGEVFQF